MIHIENGNMTMEGREIDLAAETGAIVEQVKLALMRNNDEQEVDKLMLRVISIGLSRTHNKGVNDSPDECSTQEGRDNFVRNMLKEMMEDSSDKD